MDNLTHSLVGGFVGSALVMGTERWRFKMVSVDSNDPARRHTFALAFILTCIWGNNLPDLDVLLGPLAVALGQSPKFINLLHHRGWTHTVWALIPLGALAAVLGKGVAGFFLRAKPLFQIREKLILFFAGVVSIALHIMADFMNSYGVHPFAPMTTSWVYGDSIFIVEPLFLLLLMPWCYFAWNYVVKPLQYLRLNLFFLWVFFVAAALLSALMAFAAYSGKFGFSLLELAFLMGWLLFYCGILAVIWRRNLSLHGHSPRARMGGLRWSSLVVGIVSLALLSIFAGMGYEARTFVRQRFEREGFQVLEVASSPLPGNPFRWSTQLAGISAAQIYEIWNVELKWHWPAQNSEVWQFEKFSPLFSQSESSFRELFQNCRAQAYAHFGRFPMTLIAAPGAVKLTDARYHLKNRGGFSEVELMPSAGSSKNIQGYCPDENWVAAAPWFTPIGRYFLSEKNPHP